MSKGNLSSIPGTDINNQKYSALERNTYQIQNQDRNRAGSNQIMMQETKSSDESVKKKTGANFNDPQGYPE